MTLKCLGRIKFLPEFEAATISCDEQEHSKCLLFLFLVIQRQPTRSKLPKNKMVNLVNYDLVQVNL